MQRLHNIHQGQRAFVIGTGPSLLAHDSHTLASLSDEITFGCSRLNLWEERPFKVLYQVIADRNHIEDVERGGITLSEARERFAVFPFGVSMRGWLWVPCLPNEYYAIYSGIRGMEREWQPLTNGRSSAFKALQIALWMGCDPIYLLGVDCTLKGHVYNVDDPRNEHLPPRLAEPFRVAAERMQERGRHLYCCSKGVLLVTGGYVPYRSLEEALGKIKQEVLSL